MNDSPDEQATANAVDAAAAMIGLPIAPEHRAGVIRFYALARSMAQVVLAVPLGRDDESGAVWLPVDAEATDGRG